MLLGRNSDLTHEKRNVCRPLASNKTQTAEPVFQRVLRCPLSNSKVIMVDGKGRARKFLFSRRLCTIVEVNKTPGTSP